MRISQVNLVAAVAGSTAFWAPSVLMSAIKEPDFNLLHPASVASLQILTTAAVFSIMCFVLRTNETVRRCAFSTLLGIWILGPFHMFIGFSFGGGGFAKSGGWLGVLVSTVFFPIMTPMLSFYDGSLIGLMVASLLLGLASLDMRTVLTLKGPWSNPFGKKRGIGV